MTETTTETMTKDKDGLVTRDVVTTKETTESKGVIGGARHILFKVLPWIFLLLIAAALVYYLGLVSDYFKGFHSRLKNRRKKYNVEKPHFLPQRLLDNF